jgi:hypothetical protein
MRWPRRRTTVLYCSILYLDVELTRRMERMMVERSVQTTATQLVLSIYFGDVGKMEGSDRPSHSSHWFLVVKQ